MTEEIDKNSAQTLQHFHDHGWMRVRHAFDPEKAATMCDAVWRALADVGIDRDRPSTWTVERPAHLQHLKDDPAFRAIGGKPLLAAIDAVLEGRTYGTPKNWGAFFIAFPSDVEWGIPASGWHVDAKYASALWPTDGVKTHALLADIEPRGGGTLIVSGSHRLVHKWFREHPPPSGARGADMRKLLRLHPYIRDLHAEGDPQERVARFMERTEIVDGVPLKVIENTGAAGDVILLHPLVLHVAAANNSRRPRFLLSGGVTINGWGWSSAAGVANTA